MLLLLIIIEFRVVLVLNIDGGIIVPDAPPIIVTLVEIPANALFPIVLALSDVGMVIEFNAVHPEKAEAPTLVMVFGMVIEVNAEQFWKAEAPIAVILLLLLVFIVIEVIVLLPLNIYGGIVVPVTEAVIVTLLLVVLIPANALVPTLVMVFGMVIEVNAEQFWKAEAPIEVVLLPIASVFKYAFPKKAEVSMLIILVPIVILVVFVLPLSILLPDESVVLAVDPLIVTAVEIPENAALVTLVREFGIEMEANAVHPEKAEAPIPVM